MATELEDQVSRYFLWIEEQTGSSLHRDGDPAGDAASTMVSVDAVAEIATLEYQLRDGVASRPPTHRRLLARVAIVALIAVVGGLLLREALVSEVTSTINEPSVTTTTPPTTSAAPPTTSAPSTLVAPTLDVRLPSPQQPFDVQFAVFTPDSAKVLVMVSMVLREIDAVTGEIGDLVSGGVEPTSVRINPNGTQVFDGTRLIDLTSTQRIDLPGTRADVRGDYSPDGARLVAPVSAPTGHGRATIFDTSTGEAILDLTTDEIAITWATYSPDGSKIMTQGAVGVTRIWDAATGEQLGVLDDSDSHSSFSPDGASILSLGPSGAVRVRDAVTADPTDFREVFAGFSDGRAVWFSPDGAIIALKTDDPDDPDAPGSHAVTLLDARTGAVLGRINGVSPASRFVTAVFTPDGSRLVTIGVDGAATVWSTATSTAEFELDGADLVSIAISTDGRRVVGLTSDATVRIWELS